MSFSDYAKSKFVPYLLPIIPRDATLSPRSKLTPEKLGKIPGWRSHDGWVGFPWQKHRTPESQLAAYDKMYGEAGPIIAVQAERLPGTDIDVPDADVVEEIVKIAVEEMGNAPRRGRENSARILMMYRLADGEQPLRKVKHVYKNAFTGEECAIEFLAAGQQYLIEGMHSSGVPYTWEGGLTPLFYGVDDLSPIQGENVDRFFARADETMLSLGWARTKEGAGDGRGAFSSTGSNGPRIPIGPDHPDTCPDRGMLETLLTEFLPVSSPEFSTYDAWADACIAIKTAAGGDEELYPIFERWSDANPDNVELTRAKWESVYESSANHGWSWLCHIAHDYGYTADAEVMFGALPDDPDRPNLPNQPAGPTGTPRAEPTDQFLADQFVKAYARKELIHVPAKAGGVWMRCGGGIWAPDYTAGEEAGVVCRTASDFIRRQPNPTQAQLTLARSIDSARIQTAVLNIAKTRKACSVAPELLDSRLSFMGVPGGYIDPEGKLRDPDPSLFLTRKAGCRPDFDAKCPMFDGLVRSLANFDKDVEDCLWRMVGYTITGVGDQQMFPFLHGKGNEGKTTFFTILAQVFGDYAKTFKPVIFMLGQDHRFASSAFAGAWFIYGSEIAKGARWDDAAIKEATGGGETSVEKKYVDVYQARIRFMPWFSGNNLPHFSGSDTALKRRMALFRCMRPFESVISSFDQKVFEAEGPAILAKAIRYRQGYFERQPAGNFVLAPQVQAWTTEHFEHNDATGQFIDDCLAAEKNDAAPPLLKSDVYRRFQEYARGSLGQGEAFILSKNRFFDEFEEHPKLRALGGNVCRKRLGGRDTNPQFCVTGVRLIQLFENLSAEGL